MKKWIEAMRLRTLPLAMASVFTGAAVAGMAHENYALILSFTLLTTLLLQILSNLANDYGDSINGADNAGRIGPLRAVQSGAISAAAMLRAVIITAVLALASGLWLVKLSFTTRESLFLPLIFIGMGLLAIAAAIKYTGGKNPYGYRGLGDLSVLLFFGLLGVGGTAFLLGMTFSLSVALPALAIGCLSTAVLNLNNLRDHENDAAAGKRTVVVMLGFARAKRYHLALISSAWLFLGVWVFVFQPNGWMVAIFAVLPLHLTHLKRVFATTEARLLDPELKIVALSTFFLSVILFVASLVG